MHGIAVGGVLCGIDTGAAGDGLRGGVGVVRRSGAGARAGGWREDGNCGDAAAYFAAERPPEPVADD